jgi:hypothetical protein
LMLHPMLDICPQSHEIRLNKGMKYWDSTLNAPGSRTYIGTLHITTAVISWKRLGGERARCFFNLLVTLLSYNFEDRLRNTYPSSV